MDNEKNLTKKERRYLMELICNEQIHMLLKDPTKCESEKYLDLECLKIKIGSGGQ